MNLSDRVYVINRRFDLLPQQQQFLGAFWFAAGLLYVLLLLAFYARLPFGLTAILAALVIMGPRVMYKFGHIHPSDGLPPAPAETPRIAIRGPDWAFRWNRWFDAQPDHMRIGAVAAATVGVFILDMILHWIIRTPVGLPLLLVVLVLAWARVTYQNGWLIERGTSAGFAPPAEPPVPLPPDAPEGRVGDHA